MTDPSKYFGVGRRKSAVAQVRLHLGRGLYSVGGQNIPLPQEIKEILSLTNTSDRYDISVLVRGGGKVGQIEAICLGLARALVCVNPSLRATLSKAGLLTRDSRVKERKKPGLKRARRAPQWAKR